MRKEDRYHLTAHKRTYIGMYGLGCARKSCHILLNRTLQERSFSLFVSDIIHTDLTPQLIPHYFTSLCFIMLTTHVKEPPMTYINPSNSHTLFIKENKEEKEHLNHDQLFKELIHHFFEEFLQAFFPDVHEYIDFETIKPMSEEMFTDLLEGESRRADIVIEARLKGEDTLIIIHVEPQRYEQSEFHERMYLYFSLLYNKYRKPVLPIAVFSYDRKRTEKNEYTIEFPFHKVLTFNFLKLELSQMNWKEYLQSNNPVAAALLSKMGYTEDEKIQVKKEFLRMMVKMELSRAEAEFILGFFESYLSVSVPGAHATHFVQIGKLRT